MSAATTGAVSGAASGAAAGSVLGPWGTLAGAAIGGVAGALGGLGADKQREAQAEALRRLRKATAQYGRRTQRLAERTKGETRALDDEWMAALRAHLQQYPDAAAALPGAQASWLDTQAGAAQPALTPLGQPGMTGARQAFIRRVEADRNAAAQEAALPAAFQGGYGDVLGNERQYTRALQLAQAGIDRRLGRATRAQQLQQQLYYEPLARAQREYEQAAGRASTAGSNQALASGLISGAGSLLASYGLNRQAAT